MEFLEPPPTKFVPTDEQAAAAKVDMSPGNLILIEARAGTGKTAALQHISKSHPGKKFLYTCFNKAAAESAKQRMGRNVSVSTTHSLAFARTGRDYRHKLGEMNLKAICDCLRCPPNQGWEVQQIVQRYVQSMHAEIGDMKVRDDIHPQSVDRAKTLWERMCDRQDNLVPMSHDGYLKLWAKQKPTLGGYDVVLVDEAQDLNPAMLGIVLEQLKTRASSIILVGDSCQGIYGWRGAINAMEECLSKATDRLALTESFRFGPKIAARASRVLSLLPNTDTRLVGRGGDDTGESVAFLSRTNGVLIGHAAETGGPIHFAGTTEHNGYNPMVRYKLWEALDVWNLWLGNSYKVRPGRMKKFQSFEELSTYAYHRDPNTGKSKVLDPEIASLIQLVEKYGDGLGDVILDLQARATRPNRGVPTFSSGHAAKGLEWSRVELADDFIPVFDQAELKTWAKYLDKSEILEEIRLLYVAITRAKRETKVGPDLEKWFSSSKEGDIQFGDAQ